MSSFILCFCFILSSGLAGCGVGRSTQASALKLIGGRSAIVDEFPEVVVLDDPLCTGVMVSTKHILVAGHCIQQQADDLLPLDSAGSFLVYRIALRSDGSREIEEKVTSVTARFAHPSWVQALSEQGSPDKAADQPATLDLAIIELSNALTFPTVALNRFPLVAGSQVVVAGGGCERRFQSPSGRLKVGATTVLAAESGRYALSAKDIAGKPVGGCQGDSGGPVFLGDGGEPVLDDRGRKMLAGINSVIALPSENESILDALPTAAARIDNPAALAWIAKLIQTSSEQ